MIELVFVIVILGILAAVALPKFTATRDDASISKARADLKQLVSDFSNYYTTQGTYKGASITAITDVPLVLDTALDASGDGIYDYEIKGLNCLVLTISEGQIVLSNGSNITDDICTNLQALSLKTTHVFGGSGVSFN